MPAIEICRCSAAELQSALKCLHAGLSQDQQTTFVETLNQLNARDAAEFTGLLIAKMSGELVAAAWVQFTPGSAAVVWPPAFDSPAARDLLIAVDTLLAENNVALAQMLFAASDSVDEEILGASGFCRLADLTYLTLERVNFPYPGESSLQFEPRADQHPERLGSIIAHSYAESLDCPELNDKRTPAEVIEGYKVQGRFASDNWFLVRADDADVGCLILAQHPPGENWELVYMGVVPTARGRGYGEQIVRFAAERARQGRAERLVLAVDQRNEPALSAYRRIGFVIWDRRVVYARVRNRGKD